MSTASLCIDFRYFSCVGSVRIVLLGGGSFSPPYVKWIPKKPRIEGTMIVLGSVKPQKPTCLTGKAKTFSTNRVSI